ncbi:conserved hypothetical protein [Frankia canadensis]|uniref:HTH-type transcriptional repressor KstR2 C-terminal domain-containing protein n=1 Tax=Frankia canadensis TaxID=1836972 RepID=A0A2I2KRI8_9ACTN|nr:conserved hypothetical protein [Frankia canadensis]SOU55560.1 conserved hypothetical protein [Frankia canadensis]
MPERRKEIYRAAAELFVDLGPDEVSFRDISSYLGYSPVESIRDALAGTVEADVWESPLTQVLEQYFRIVNASLAQAAGGAADRLAALVRGTMIYYVRYQTSALVLRQRVLMRAMDRSTLGEKVVERGASQIFGDIVRQGLEEGVFLTPFPADARRSIEAACTAMLEWYDHRGAVGPDQLIERYVRLALATVEYTGLA